jgi:predicted metal-dependent phosphoesterase TrpH/glycosyltransferase involved in cell wall biosynthesis
MSLRICLVTPFSWPQPHEVNEHVDAVARELRGLGHDVTVLAPSNRADDLREGRKALQRELLPNVVALGPALQISRRSAMGMPVGVRANLALALSVGGFDVVHGFEPGLPSLSYLALREAAALSVATFFSPERLAYPLGKAQRDRLLARVDALIATTPDVAAAARARFPGDFRIVPRGVDTTLFAPAKKTRRIVLELDPAERPTARAAIRTLDELPGWELILLRTRPLSARPAIPRRLRERVYVRTTRDPAARAALLGSASIFVPAAEGSPALRLEAAAVGAAIAAGPEEIVELALNEGSRESRARETGTPQSFAEVAAELDRLYRRLARRKRVGPGAPALFDRDWILCDLHMHTSWSHDCSVEVEELLDYAEEQGLGAIAVTDHNAFGGAVEAVEAARGRNLVVIPGEEIKTDRQGEVIGLFLQEEIPRGMPFADTLAAIRAQGGLVYLPHPFDRRHTIPDPAILHRHLAEIDVFEVYNARLLFETYNDEALRFARKYNLTMGAGSDAHVLPGVGTGAMSMRAFRNAEEFMISLHSAQVLRRPKSLAYLQSLKWMAQVKEKVL